MADWYLSFATDDGFRGAAYVGPAETPEEALALASSFNPGGDVMVLAIPAELSSQILNSERMRLLTFDDLTRIDQRICGQDAKPRRLGDLPQDLQDDVDRLADHICQPCNDGGMDVH